MAVILEFRSRSAKALRDQQKMIDAAKDMAKGYKEGTDEAKKLERALKQLNRSGEKPQERHNRKMQELVKLMASGRIGVDQLKRGQERYNRELREAQTAGRRAFGSEALQSLTAFAGGLFSIQRAGAAVVDVMREIDQLRSQRAQQAIDAADAFGGLVQLAGPDKQLQRVLFNASKQTFAEGGFKTLDEAQRLVFELGSAGALGERKFFSNLQSIDDAAQIANTGARVKEAFKGGDQVGTFQQLTSKAIAGATPATGVSPSGILSGVAQASENAKKLGLSDEEVFAAVSRISQVTGSGEQAGTRADSLFRSLIRQGFADRPNKGGLGGILQEVRGRGLSEAELITFFGRQEAAQAFGALDPGIFSQRLGEIQAGQRQNLAGRTIANAFATPEVGTARRARAAAAAEQLSTERLDRLRAEVDAARKRQLVQDRRVLGDSFTGELLLGIGEKADDFRQFAFGDEEFVKRTGLRVRRQGSEDFSNVDLQIQMLEQQQQQTEALRRIEQNQSAKPPVTRTQGRQE